MMKIGTARNLGFSCALAYLLGCTPQAPSQPNVDDSPCAGTSVGCSNPPKVAWEPDLTQVNECPASGCGGGAVGPTNFQILLGKTLDLEFKYPRYSDTPKVRLAIYAHDQIPVFNKEPLDTLVFASRNSISILPEDLDGAIRKAMPGSVSPVLFTFNIHLQVTPVTTFPTLVEEGWLAGLGLDIQGGKFISSARPSWGDSSAGSLPPLIRYFEGKVVSDSIDSELAAASEAFVFVPGSPYSTPLNLQDSLFRMEGLPAGGFELRMIAIPVAIPDNRLIPVYLLKADTGSGPDRRFLISRIVDSVTIPD